jgi:transposase-like protein
MREAITAVFPQYEHQLCIVHQIRNSLAYESYKDRKELAADLKPIYTEATEDEALLALESLESKWGQKYPFKLILASVIHKSLRIVLAV